MDRQNFVCGNDRCGMCCGGNCSSRACSGCGAVQLTRAECDLLLTFAELPFQPVVSRDGAGRPVLAYADEAAGERSEEISPDVITGLADKFLIQVDYDIPLGNYDYRGFEDYPYHGSMALTYRGQQVVDELSISGTGAVTG